MSIGEIIVVGIYTALPICAAIFIRRMLLKK
ncbi:hypothetical protein ES703_113150 [subsurface metagenome]